VINNSISQSGAAISILSGTATVAGNQLYTNTIVFSQTGGTLSAYANNIGNFTTGVAISNGAFDGCHNWWGSNDPNATKPGGLDDADWQVRLGAPVKTWADGSGNTNLQDSSNGGNAILTGGSGTAVIISYGRAFTATQAPFSNGVIVYVGQMCSDFYDFFTVGGSGMWSVSVPVDNAATCDDTYHRGFVYTIPPTTTYNTECSPSTNPACWQLVSGNVITSGRNITVANLSVSDLGGTPFVAGDVPQHNPTTVTLVNFRSAPACLDEALPVLLFGCGLIGGSAAILRRRGRSQRAR
jgi:hypothetical protein